LSEPNHRGAGLRVAAKLPDRAAVTGVRTDEHGSWGR
jgi:hypothetical protein